MIPKYNLLKLSKFKLYAEKTYGETQNYVYLSTPFRYMHTLYP